MKKQIVLAQTDFFLGDVEKNLALIFKYAEQAIKIHEAQLIVFPELTLTGYPPEDLLLRPSLSREIKKAFETLKKRPLSADILIGYPEFIDDKIYNACALIKKGEVIANYRKQCLPNYNVFDEKRYFKSGTDTTVIDWEGIKLGLLICEDVWFAQPIAKAKAQGAQLIITINASPFAYNKSEQRTVILKTRNQETQLPILYSHWAAGQDELLFDGGSFAIDASGMIIAKSPYFKEDLLPICLSKQDNKLLLSSPHNITTAVHKSQLVYDALVFGLADYVKKNHFEGVLLGLSGGVDSALTLAIAVDALGADKVHSIMLPFHYTSNESIEDAKILAQNLKVHHDTLPIESIFNAAMETLQPLFEGFSPDVTEENLQARSRGLLLMALSNKWKKLLLTTGNKSEMAVGYATLYGDMCGGYAVIKDVYKTLVYELCQYRNTISPVIPQNILTRAPSAELAPNQKDEDSLPPYPILDGIIKAYVEDDLDLKEIVELGYDAKIVETVIHLINHNEYKRRQSAPGIRITERAFGKDRRYPISWSYPHNPKCSS
jgi:NAD+ synthase (glutamine-hydrolysing)